MQPTSPEDIIRSVLACIRAFLDGPEFTEQYMREFDEIVGLLNRANPWHPASELPDKAGDYIVVIYGAAKPTTLFYFNGSWFNADVYELTGEKTCYKVTHWMQMPEPPEGE